jgi:hypothetical protein
MPQSDPDLKPGSVLHIKKYSSRGHPSKNKYVFVVGFVSETVIAGFLISSQLSYLQQETHKKEIVRIPHNATSFLRAESIIQCFEMERLSMESICQGFQDGSVTCCGRLGVKYLYNIRKVVEGSRLLAQMDIESLLQILPTPRA